MVVVAEVGAATPYALSLLPGREESGISCTREECL